jgi:plastocyanin
VVVEAINYEFSQADLTIAPNTLVRWVNTTGTTHTVTPDGHSEWADTSLPDMGDTFEHVFRTEGSFPYYCTPHRSFGMVGTVTVQAP